MVRLIYVVLVMATCSVSTVESFNCRPDENVTPVCSDDSVTSNIVYLSGVTAGDNTTQCSCSLSTGTPTNITITEHQNQHGCQYKFQFVYMTTSWIYSCTQTYLPIISKKTSDSIEINVLQDDRGGGGFTACLQIQAESPVTLSCGKSRWPTSSYKPDIQTSFTDNTMNVIIGGSVGGLIVLAITILVIVCVVRKRKRDVIYDSTDVIQNDPHAYSSISEKGSREISRQPTATNDTVHMENTIDNNTPNYVNQQLEYVQNGARSDGDKLPVAADYVNVEKSKE